MKNDSYLRHTRYFKNSIAYFNDFGDGVFRCFFFFFFFFFLFFFFFFFMFQAVRAVNGAKTGPIRQKILSVMLHISATIHHMILFMVHICKMMTSAGFFFIFSKLLFSGSRGVGKRAKKTQNDKKCLTLYFRNNILYDCDLWYTCVKW